jgi:outer membrane protein OmpA-like peptidoglycan-associated protein
MVSGMLTAVQDFVRDSMAGAAGENLDMIRMGDVGVVLAYTADAILCGYVRGVPPRHLTRVFQDALDGIVQQSGDKIRKFSGDDSAFESCRPQLERCLLGQAESTEQKATPKTAKLLVFGVPALLLMLLIGWWTYSLVMERRFSNFAQKISAQPGFVVTQAEKRGGRYVIAGLRDPLADKAADLLAGSGLPAGQVDFQLQDYHSLQPGFVNLRNFVELKNQLERRAFRFATGATEIPPEQRFLLEDVAAQAITLLKAASEAHKRVTIEIRGNHDPVGTEDLNTNLAKGRAESVRIALISMGVPWSTLSAEEVDDAKQGCSAVREEERLLCRSASFRVIEK